MVVKVTWELILKSVSGVQEYKNMSMFIVQVTNCESTWKTIIMCMFIDLDQTFIEKFLASSFF